MPDIADVFITGGKNRDAAIRDLLGAFDLSSFSGTSVAIKANFNSADPFPASTHPDTLGSICRVMTDKKPSRITLAERSGMGDTREVLEWAGVFDMARELGFSVAVLDELDRGEWQEVQATGLHWSRGFFLAKAFAQADHVIQTCCLKTHRYGGNFTLSLKNMVGAVAKRVPGLDYNFMSELHSSPHQRRMIAEINRFCRADIVIMDAISGFASGGPDRGKLIHPGIMLAGSDRVAIDATGVALLRSYGTVPAVMNGKIFEQEQIARAAELGIGIGSAEKIRLIPLDEPAKKAAEQIRIQLDRDGSPQV